MHLGVLLLMTAAAGAPWRDRPERPDRTEVIQVIYVNNAAYVYPLVQPHAQHEKRDDPHHQEFISRHRPTPRQETDGTAPPAAADDDFNEIKIVTNGSRPDATAEKVYGDCENKTRRGDATLKINCKQIDQNEITDGHIVITTKTSGDEGDEKWIWGKVESTTEVPAAVTTVELDDRAAFSGDKCPDGKVKVAGKCVHQE